MTETLTFIISGISIAGGIAGVFFFKNKYATEAEAKTNRIAELERSLSKAQEASKEQSENNSGEHDALKANSAALEAKNKEISAQLATAQSEIFSLKEECVSLGEKNISDLAHADKQLGSLNAEITALQIQLEEAQNRPVVVESSPVEVVEEKTANTVLFVDDSAVIRAKMKKTLVEAGYNLTLAVDGVDALKILEEKKFDLIITDLEMPNLDGLGLMLKLEEEPATKDIPVVIVTGHDEVEIKTNKISNLYGVCKKPWNDVELLKRVKALSNLN